MGNISSSGLPAIFAKMNSKSQAPLEQDMLTILLKPRALEQSNWQDVEMGSVCSRWGAFSATLYLL